MRTTLALTLALFCGIAQAQEAGKAEPKKKGDKKPAATLEGIYEIVSGKQGEEAIPADHIKGSEVVFTKDEIIGTGQDKKNLFVCKYKLMATDKMPWTIDMTSTKPAEGEATGLIKMNKKDGTMTLIYNLPGGEKPTNFKAKKLQHLFVMKKKGDRFDPKEEAAPPKKKKIEEKK